MATTALFFSGLNSLLNEADRKRYLNLPEVQHYIVRAQNTLEQKFGIHKNLLALLETDRKRLYSLENINFVTILIIAIQMGIYKKIQGLIPKIDWITSVSLGDVARTIVAGSIEFEDAVQISNLDANVKKGFDHLGLSIAIFSRPGTMISQDEVEILSSFGASVSQLSQRVLNVAGTYEAVALAKEFASSRRWKTLDLLAYPAHSDALKNYSQLMAKFVKDFDLKSPKLPIFSSTLITPISTADELVKEQSIAVTHPHHWLKTIQHLTENEKVDQFINIGPCRSLVTAIEEVAPSARLIEAQNLIS